MEIVLTTATGLGLGNMAKTIAQQGIKALPQLLAAIGGAAGGQAALDKVTKQITGRTWTEHIHDGGLNNYNTALFQPGAWGGSYAASKLIDGLINNGVSQIVNQIPRTTITPNGVKTIYPGEIVTEGITTYPVNRGSVYQGSYTTKTGGSRGNSAGQSNGIRYSQGNKSYKIPGGIQRRIFSDVNSKTFPGGYEELTYYNPLIPISPTSGYMLPWFNTPNPKYIPTPPYTPQNDYRYEEFTNFRDSFYDWFGSMKGTNKEGTIQYWNGENSSFGPGSYKIIWGGKSDPKIRRRRVGDTSGSVVRDSTTYDKKQTTEQVNKLSGGVPNEAVRTEEKIRGFNIGGKLISKRKRKFF